MGHTHCSAVQIAADGGKETRALAKLAERMHPAIRAARDEGLRGRDMLDRAERENAYHSVAESLRRSPSLAKLVEKKKFMMRAAVYSLQTGRVEWLPTRRHRVSPPQPKKRPHARGLPPHVALQMLWAGHHRFLSRSQAKGDISLHRRRKLVAARSPFAVVVTCADSRVPPEHIFDVGLGELVVIRVAGNVASDEVIASIEHAVAHTGTGLCVVLGHQGCGAVKAAIDHAHDPGLSPSMRSLLARIEPAVERARRIASTNHTELMPTAVAENARQFLDKLRQGSELLRGRENNGTFVMVPAIYLLASGDIRWLKETGGVSARPGKRDSFHPAAPAYESRPRAGSNGGTHHTPHGDKHGKSHGETHAPGRHDGHGSDREHRDQDAHSDGLGDADHRDHHAAHDGHGDHGDRHEAHENHEGHGPAPHGENHAAHDEAHGHSHAANKSRGGSSGLLTTLTIAALLSIAGMLGVLFWQRRRIGSSELHPRTL